MKEGKSQVDELLSEIENFCKTNGTYEIETKISRRIKNINLFKLDFIDGSIKKLFKKGTIKDFKDRFSIKKTNRIVGFTPDFVGIVPSGPVNFDNIYIKLFKDNFKSIKIDFPIIFKNLINSSINFREVFKGSYDSNSEHLKQFFSDNSSKITAFEIINSLKDCKWIHSPFIKYDNFDSSQRWLNYNPDSHPGHYTEKLFRTKFKGNTIVYSWELAKRKFELISLVPIRNYCLWDIFAREKDINVGSFSKQKEPSTRVVMNTEHYETLLLSYFFQPLIKGIDSFGKNTKFHISGEYDGSKTRDLYLKSQNYDFYVDADWTFFDASIDTEYLKAAGAMMFSNCISDRDDLRRIFHVISSFVTKYVAVPPGIVVELNRGNPSGHPGVTAVNCFVNIIRWAMIGKEIYGDDYQDYMDIEVYGDDALVFFKHSEKLIKIDEIIMNLGFKSDSLSGKIYPCCLFGIYEDEGPDFLKRRVNKGNLSWNLNKMIDKLIYQSKKRSIEDQINLLVNYYTTAPGNSEMYEFTKFSLQYFSRKYRTDFNIQYLIKENLKLIEGFQIDRFTLFKKNQKLFSDEFKVMKTSIQIPKERIKMFGKLTYSKDHMLEMARLLFFINEYTCHPYKIKNILNVAIRKLLFKILIRFKHFKYFKRFRGVFEPSTLYDLTFIKSNKLL